MKYAALSLALLASPVAAQDLIVQFADNAPTQKISLHTAGCEITNAIVMIDLGGSQSGYSFDAEPVEITHGFGALSPVRGGDTSLQVLVRSLEIGDRLDLETALANSLEGAAGSSGIAGASVRLALSDRVVSGVFDTGGTATLALPTDAEFCLAAAD